MVFRLPLIRINDYLQFVEIAIFSQNNDCERYVIDD